MKSGDYVTVKFLSFYKKTHIGFMRVTKIGHKYVYVVTLWNTNQDGIKLGHPIKYDMNKITVYPGIRQDLRDILDKYESNYRQWQTDREKREREIDWEIRNLKEERLDVWKTDNPMPQFPEIPEPN